MLVLAAVTAVVVSGFLFRAAQEARLATRSVFNTAALNLAEAGIEEGLFASNTSILNSTNGWTVPSDSSTSFVKSIASGYDYGQATGAIYIRIDSASGTNPIVTATGVITIPNQPSIIKQLRVGTTSRHLWGNGIVAKGVLTFGGSSDVDAYDSSLGAYNTITNRSDAATIATDSTAISALNVSGSATIYGYVATGGSQPVVGGSGRIYGSTTPAGTQLDSSRVRTDFNTNLTDASAPTTTSLSIGNISTSTTLPRVGDSPGANGRYLYRASQISLGGSDTVIIAGPVDIISDGDISMGGTSAIAINATGASLNLYCSGTISMGGHGVTNASANPANVAIWGTQPSSGTQTITLGGTSDFYGTLYAPNGNLTLSGNADTFGAAIAKAVTMSGNGGFHYDTHLALLNTSVSGSSSSTTLAVGSWVELTAKPGSGDAFARDNRAPFASLF